MVDADSNDEASVATEGVFDLEVKAHDGSQASRVEIGDALYWTDKDTELDKDSGQKFYGVALEEIESGSTETIKVMITPKMAAPGTVGETDLEDNAVTEAKLAGSLQDQIAKLSITATDDEDGTATLTIQAQDAEGNSLAEKVLFRFWTGGDDDLGGDAITGVTVSTGTQKEEVSANEEYLVITDSTGEAVLSLDNGGPGSIYAWCEMGGRIQESGEISISGGA